MIKRNLKFVFCGYVGRLPTRVCENIKYASISSKTIIQCNAQCYCAYIYIWRNFNNHLVML